MKILIVGVLDDPVSTTVQIKQAFQDLGHEVVDFNYRTIGNKVGYPKMESQLIDKVKLCRPDFCFLCKTNKMNPNYILKINKLSRTWYWWMDCLPNCMRNKCVEFAKRASWCSATSIDVFKSFRRVNENSHKIYEGFNPDIFHPIDLSKKYEVIFVGLHDSKRAMTIKALRKSGISVTTFGQGFDNPSIYLEELNRLHNESKIVLNICSADIFSNRVFDATGSGAFLLSECRTDLKVDFPGFVCFKDNNECISLVKYYLSHSEERKAAAKLNYNAIQDYTWKRQMEKVLKIIN